MPRTELTRFQEARKRLSVPLARYVGRWVAVRDHKVIADAATPGGVAGAGAGPGYEADVEVFEAQRGRLFLLRARARGFSYREVRLRGVFGACPVILLGRGISRQSGSRSISKKTFSSIRIGFLFYGRSEWAHVTVLRTDDQSQRA